MLHLPLIAFGPWSCGYLVVYVCLCYKPVCYVTRSLYVCVMFLDTTSCAIVGIAWNITCILYNNIMFSLFSPPSVCGGAVRTSCHMLGQWMPGLRGCWLPPLPRDSSSREDLGQSTKQQHILSFLLSIYITWCAVCRIVHKSLCLV